MKELALCTVSRILGGYLASQVDAMEHQAGAKQTLAGMIVCLLSVIGSTPLLLRLIDKYIMTHSKPLNNQEDK